jgi:hypothetical protein
MTHHNQTKELTTWFLIPSLPSLLQTHDSFPDFVMFLDLQP